MHTELGRKKTVYVYNLIGTIPNMMSFDEKLDNLLSKKQSVKGAALFPSAKLEIDTTTLMDYLCL